MDEGTNKAIPLRRSRSTARAVTLRQRGWTDGLTAGVRRMLEPPRQLWLASLGGTALTIRGARTAWSQAVAEGVVVEDWLRRSLGGAAEAETPDT
jgi:hypothetical protein